VRSSALAFVSAPLAQQKESFDCCNFACLLWKRGKGSGTKPAATQDSGQQLLAAAGDAAASCSSEQLEATLWAASGALLMASKW